MDIEKFERGLNDRLEAFVELRTQHTASFVESNSKHSYSLETIFFNENNYIYSDDPNVENFIDYSSFTYVYRIYEAKDKFVSQFKGYTFYDFLRYVAVGDTISPKKFNNSCIELTSSDYSLVVRDNLVDRVDLSKLNRKLIGKFVRELGYSFGSISRNIRVYDALATNKPLQTSIDLSLIRLKSSFRNYIRYFWPIIGSYLPHSLFNMIDPEVSLTKTEIKNIRSESTLFYMEELFEIFYVLRSLNEFDSFDKNCKNSIAAISKIEDSNLIRKIFNFIHEEYRDSLNNYYSGKNKLYQIIDKTINIYCILNLKLSRDFLFDAIIDLYNTDADSVDFLEWSKILSYIDCSPPVNTPRSLFISILLSNPAISRRFPYSVGLAAGFGRSSINLFLQADEFRSNVSNPNLDYFLRGFLGLKGSARRLLYEYLSEKSISDRLYATFSSFESPSVESQYDVVVSQCRLKILHFIRKNKILDIGKLRKTIKEEQSILRTLKFKEILGRGRIKIDDSELFVELVALLESEFAIDHFNERIKRAKLDSSPFIDYLFSVMADSVVDFSVFDSDLSAEAVLSNNLRHGVLAPQILNAFDIYGARTSELELVKPVKREFEECINRYINQWLTIERGGPTDQQLRKLLKQKFAKAVADAKTFDAVKISDIVLNELEICLKNTANAACNAFKNQLKVELDIIFDKFKSTHWNEHVTLLERISKQLNRAYSDATSWLSFVDEEGHISSFHLPDLIGFEASPFLGRRESNGGIKVLVERRSSNGKFRAVQNDQPVDGKYFDCLSTVALNLISNATKYSGLENNTNAGFTIRIDREYLVFRLDNGISESLSLEEIQSQYTSAQNASLNANSAKRANEEGGSGYKKVYRSCIRRFGDCRINMPPVSLKKKRFIVEVIVPRPSDFFLSPHGLTEVI